MKKSKLISILGVTLSVSLLFTACANNNSNGATKLTAEEIISKVSENSKSIKSYDMNMDMDIDMSVSDQSLAIKSTAKGTFFTDPVKMKMTMDMDMGSLGKQSVETYAEEVDSKLTMYTKVNGAWQSQELSTSDLGDISQYDLEQSMNIYLDNAKNFKQTGEETINGVDTYKIEGTISGESLEKVMNQSGALNSMESAGIDESTVSSLYKDMGDMPFVIWVDKENLNPMKYEMDMTDIMKKMMEKVIEMAGSSNQTANLDLKVNTFKIITTISNYNKGTSFEIPAEAKQ